LSGNIGAAKALDVLLAGSNALVSAFGSLENGGDGCCHASDIVRVDIEGIGTACFFETGTSTGNNGETCGNCLDNRDAKAFVTGGIDKGFCKVIDGGKVVVRDAT
jgi:hypothetical protein